MLPLRNCSQVAEHVTTVSMRRKNSPKANSLGADRTNLSHLPNRLRSLRMKAPRCVGPTQRSEGRFATSVVTTDACKRRLVPESGRCDRSRIRLLFRQVKRIRCECPVRRRLVHSTSTLTTHAKPSIATDWWSRSRLRRLCHHRAVHHCCRLMAGFRLYRSSAH